MVNYVMNFVAKLLLLPVLAVLGCILLVAFLFLPQVRLIRNKSKSRRTNHGHKEKSQDYEAFY